MEANLKQETGEIVSADSMDKPRKRVRTRHVRRRSDVWAFMEYHVSETNNSSYVECKLCGLFLTASSRSGTSNLRNHLMNRHSEHYKPETIPDRHRLRGTYSSPQDVTGSNGKDQIKAAGRTEEGQTATACTPIPLALAVSVGAAPPAGGSSQENGRSQNSTDADWRNIIPQKNIEFALSTTKRTVVRRNKGKMRLLHGNGSPSRKKDARSIPRSDQFGATANINNSLFQLLIKDLLPITVMEGTGFQEFVGAIVPGYTFPMSLTLSIEDRLISGLVEGRLKLAQQLSGDVKMGLSCELWTDYQDRNYITVTSHVINADWKNETWLLGTIKVKTNATDIDVAQQIKDICQDCGVAISDVPAMVYGTDGKQSVANTTERLKVLKSICAFLNIESRPCAGELLGISVQNALGIPSLAKLIQDAGQLISHLSTDQVCQVSLAKMLKDHNKSLTLTICDTSSRWHVISDMFSQLAELEGVIGEVLGADHEANLTEGQWRLLHELIQALQGVKAAVAVMGDARNKPGSCLLPVMHGVLQHIDTPQEDDISDDGQVFRNILSTELKTRCELNEIVPSALMMQAAAIDPRFHHLRFLSDEDRVPVIEGLKQRLGQNHREGEQNASPEAEEDSPFFALLGEDEFNKKSIKPEDEIDLFRLERPVSRETDPLTWWRLNGNRFPGLCKLAKSILCVPIAATPLGRSGDIARTLENRRRLDPVHIDAQLFLHQNTSLFT